MFLVVGDCQNDSPGHTAAYGTYTLMDCDSHKIMAQVKMPKSMPLFEKHLELSLENVYEQSDNLEDNLIISYLK